MDGEKAVYRQNAPKQQPKKLPKSEPYEGNSDVQQVVNTLSQALNQSMVVSSETEVGRNERALSVYSESQSFQTWLSQILQCGRLVSIRNLRIVELTNTHCWINLRTKSWSYSNFRNPYLLKNSRHSSFEDLIRARQRKIINFYFGRDLKSQKTILTDLGIVWWNWSQMRPIRSKWNM